MKKPPGKGHAIGSKAAKPSVHPAIREISVGRGYGITRVPVVDLVRYGKNETLHVVKPIDKSTLCGTTGTHAKRLEACDPKALMVLGKPVCGRCRKALGHVPMPRLVNDRKAP